MQYFLSFTIKIKSFYDISSSANGLRNIKSMSPHNTKVQHSYGKLSDKKQITFTH